jgi:hypothetical protein
MFVGNVSGDDRVLSGFRGVKWPRRSDDPMTGGAKAGAVASARLASCRWILVWAVDGFAGWVGSAVGGYFRREAFSKAARSFASDDAVTVGRF